MRAEARFQLEAEARIARLMRGVEPDVPGQLMLFPRGPMQVYTDRAMDYLERRWLGRRVRVVTCTGFAPAEGTFLGFRWMFGGLDLVIRQEPWSTRHIGPAAVLSIEPLSASRDRELGDSGPVRS